MNDYPYLRAANDLAERREHAFAACNTCTGFESAFSRLFDPRSLSRLYLLKGGPGVGKSTLMKRAAESAEKSGRRVIRYHCSSDPRSLDAVSVPESRVAVVDATPPHTLDPVFAGAKDVILDMGTAWDLKKLRENADVIVRLSDEKAAFYRTAYRMLAASAEVETEARSLAAGAVRKEKMIAAAARLCKKIKAAAGTGEEVERIYSANSRDGRVRFFTPEKKAETLLFVTDCKGTGKAFLQKLHELCAEEGVGFERGIDPTLPRDTESLFFPSSSVCVSAYDADFAAALDKAARPYGVINTARFFDPELFRAHRTRFRFLEKCKDALLAEAFGAFAAAGEKHAALEAVYAEATDYRKVEKMAVRL